MFWRYQKALLRTSSWRLAAGLLLIILTTSCLRHSEAKPTLKLRVCADPNNLPFSNQRGQGFENKLAEMLADELGTQVEYTWWAQRRGFIRNTLKAGLCDVVMGVPHGFAMAETTAPYYRSTYVFVSRHDSGRKFHSFDDAVLRRVKVGIQIIGDDGANAPPAHALARRGIVRNVRGYTVYGDYTDDSPPARIIDAVTRGEIDVAIAWGPLAGYFVQRQPIPLELVPVAPRSDPALPFTYAIALGVRRGESAFKDELEHALKNRRSGIEKLLDDYGIPRIKE